MSIDAGAISAVHSLAEHERLSFPILLATQEVAGIYNIIYRYLFDRHRDLPIPVSFLLDAEGMMSKSAKVPSSQITSCRTSDRCRPSPPIA